MTTREFLNAVATSDVVTEGLLIFTSSLENSSEMKAYAKDALAKLDKANEARRTKMAEKAVAREAERTPIRTALMACLTGEPKTASTLIEEAGVDIKPQAVPALLKLAISDGAVAKEAVKVPGKSTKQVGYKLVD